MNGKVGIWACVTYQWHNKNSGKFYWHVPS